MAKKPKIKARHRATEKNRLMLPVLPTMRKKKGGGPVPMLDGPLGEEILRRIAGGETLKAICREEGMPEARTVQLHVFKNPEFAVLYNLAHKMKYEAWADELKEVSDNPLLGEKVTETTGGQHGDSTKTETYDAVERARLKADTLKWLMSKGNPERYGEKLQTENKTDMNVNLQVRSVKIVFVKPEPLKVIDGR